MTGYLIVGLGKLVSDSQIDTDEVKCYLQNSFSCPYNKDIESFLCYKAIDFQKQGIASTYLVMASLKGKYVLVGYFTLANKVICLDRWDKLDLSKRMKRRMNKFAMYDRVLKRYTIPVPLIGQLGKNYLDGNNKLIAGNELLKFALDKISIMQDIVGGRMLWHN